MICAIVVASICCPGSGIELIKCRVERAKQKKTTALCVWAAGVACTFCAERKYVVHRPTRTPARCMKPSGTDTWAAFKYRTEKRKSSEHGWEMRNFIYFTRRAHTVRIIHTHTHTLNVARFSGLFSTLFFSFLVFFISACYCVQHDSNSLLMRHRTWPEN